MSNNDFKIINIISGKGGTGKTLLAAVLAEELGNKNIPVLVIDLDIFVRGLTSLLFFHREGAVNLTKDNELSIYDVIKNRSNESVLSSKQIAAYQYRSFHICPSVPRIDSQLSLKKQLPESIEDYRSLLKLIFDKIPRHTFRYVFLDSRSGYDNFISATHSLSDISICVQEDDDISDITANNLIGQLKGDSDNVLFRLINKARDIETSEDLDKIDKIGVDYLGKIPFDMDVMKSFGKPSFWDDISKSLYKYALKKIWNRLSGKMRFDEELYLSRISPFASNKYESRISMLTLKERIYFIYGLVLAVFGLSYGLVGKDILIIFKENPMQFVSISIGLFGIAMVFYSLFKSFRK